MQSDQLPNKISPLTIVHWSMGIAVLSIILAASAITKMFANARLADERFRIYSESIEARIDDYDEKVDVLEVRYTNLLAELRARNVRLPEEYYE